jgi:outer membrane protein OmpA-like peptidoglycan-associated protein
MAPPGTLRKKGFIEHGKRDNPVLVRNSKVPPTVISNVGKMKEGVSRSVPLKRSLAYTNVSGMIVAEIYFATDDDQVHTSDDIIALDSLIKDIITRLNDGFRIKLFCIGEADYRASFDYNWKLGFRRALSVKNYIESRVKHKRFSIDFDSKGESSAIQPLKGKRPSRMEMMRDRKVVVQFDKNGYMSPVMLAVEGNWILGNKIEENEINNGGHIVAMPGSIEAQATEEEFEYWKTGRTQANKGLEQDPFLPVAVIKTNYYIKKVNNKDEAFVECAVIHYMTNHTLFTASARTDSRNKITEVYSYSPGNTRVMRKVLKDSVVEEGRLTKERTLEDWEVNSRGLYLFDPVYAQLKGSYRTVTERVAAMLGQK